MLDRLVVLEAPSFDKIIEWRQLQETKLRNSHMGNTQHIMTDEQVSHFIMHFERITRHNLATLPTLADLVLSVNDEHVIYASRTS